ncbi:MULTISPECIES: tyrosine-type recombinase/integrase [Vibrio]|uniref:tyrosine-type recombinase/integrase n=1 Tax=Vibrio TaxID=662 RepID=UPI001D975D84|nr:MULTISPECIES: site-specific integrase [Vibrio]MBR9789005.1 integrase arm-type DNA-binding domain-containing protein [Vibrionaceae bacterium]MCS0292965.1 integrase arm-type DNA-binding domain-containing protein [Vibrio alginolyticus]MDZ5517027.1 integrase arm-type DNA-binding domain-containing protein [Vibrio fluvialis]
MAITQKEILALKPQKNAYYKFDDDRTKGAGRLGVKVQSSGNKSFVFRYYRDGKRAFILLGRFPELSLVKAREAAKKLGALVVQGLDPKYELEAIQKAKEVTKKEEAEKGNIEQLFFSYTSQMKKDGKRTYETVLKSLKKEVYPYLSPKTKACDVSTQDIKLILSKMIQRGAATQSNRVRSYLHAAFNHGLTHENDPANFVDGAKFSLTSNPVSAIPKQRSAERAGKHYLTYDELKTLTYDMEFDLEGVRAGPTIRNLILLCVHTGGQRPYELAASQWSAINWAEKTLLVTEHLSKNKKAHIIPLTETAIKVLKSQKIVSRGSSFIFPHHKTDTHIRLDSLSQAVARYREDHPNVSYFVARDIRRTSKTLMGELGISKLVRDRLQNHALSDVSSKHYDMYEYLPEKKDALEAWEKKLSSLCKNDE